MRARVCGAVHCCSLACGPWPVAGVCCQPRLHAVKTVFIADVAHCPLDGGNAAESAETCESKEHVLQLARAMTCPTATTAAARSSAQADGAHSAGEGGPGGGGVPAEAETVMEPLWLGRPYSLLEAHLASRGVRRHVHTTACALSGLQQAITDGEKI